MYNIHSSILERNPNANVQTVLELAELVQKHNLKWIPANKDGNNGAYFIASDLSLTKGLDKHDYKDNWCDKLTERIVNAQSESNKLAGREYKLEGTALKAFKKMYKDIHGISLGRTRSLLVVDWERAYSYLVQGHSETAKGFQVLGAKSITREVDSGLKELRKSSHYQYEIELHRDLAYLSTMTNYTLKSEVSVKDFDDSNCKSRRYDLIHQMPHRSKGKVVTIYEIKKDIITLNDLQECLENRRYLELAHKRFGNHVKFVFIAPWGGDGEALQYVQFLDNVEIIPALKFTEFLLSKVDEKHKSIDPYFSKLLRKDNPIIKKLLSNPNNWISNKYLT